MTKIERFSRSSAGDIRDQINAALAPVAKDLGIQLEVGNVVLGGSNATFRVEAAVLNDAGVAQTQEVRSFELYGEMYGLEKEDFGGTFTHRGDTFELCGLNMKAPKYPIQAKRLRDGRVYRFVAPLKEKICRKSAA